MSMWGWGSSNKNDGNKTQLEPSYHRTFYIFMLSLMFTVLIYIIYVTDTISKMLKNQRKSDDDETKEKYVSITSVFILFGTLGAIIFLLQNYMPYWVNDSNNSTQCVNMCSDAYNTTPNNMCNRIQQSQYYP